MHPTMLDYLKSLEREGRGVTADCYKRGLKNFQTWLDAEKLSDPLKTTKDQLEKLQTWLAQDYRSSTGMPLGRGTQGTRLAAVKSYYAWLHLHGLILVDPAREIRPPKVSRSTVNKDHLSQQEATALLQTQAQYAASFKEGSEKRAVEFRNLAMLALALATGRRRTSLISLRIKDLDFNRNEIRIEWEKGKPGRVLPCVGWAMAVAKEYVEKARVRLLNGRSDPSWLFISAEGNRVHQDCLRTAVAEAQARAAEANPDLEDLGGKRIGTHGLRVTFATLLFLNGAGIRDVNEMLMHEELSTTAKYTPLELEDLRHALKLAHPRA